METSTKQATRIQTSIINGAERKALNWMSARMPAWVTSDILTWVGIAGAVLIGLGFILSDYNINWLWLSSFGLVVNWFGDSMDGSIARYRNTQRPIYGYYLDHTVDCINMTFMFAGIGLSQLARMDLALFAYLIYTFLIVNVSINAHLKSEFKLTYAKLGPTEFRIIVIILNTLLIFIEPLRRIAVPVEFLGRSLVLRFMDFVCIFVILLLGCIYLCTIISDARGYARIDPPKKFQK